MRKLLKVLGVIVGVFVVLIVLLVGAVFIISQGRIDKSYSINPTAPPIPTDAASIAEGERLATIRGCNGCHAPNLAGQVMIDGAPGHFVSANLTAGKGGIGGKFSDVDYVRAIRHGVGQDGKGMLVMPADDYSNLSDADLGKLIAYLKSVKPVDNDLGDSSVGFLFRALMVTGQLSIISAERVDHAAPVNAPPPGVTVEYGKYMASTCQGCHTMNFSGGPVPGAQPGEPNSANLTPAGVTKDWTEAQFISFLRTGTDPTGKQIDPRFMPWPGFSKMTDDEIKAIFMFLKSLPPLPANTK